jgi:acid phosphatase type 7
MTTIIYDLLPIQYPMRKLLTTIVSLFFLLIFETSFSQRILVDPYIQPGNVSTLVKEEKVVIWQTDSVPGKFIVNYVPGSFTGTASKPSVAKISSETLVLNNRTTILYRARLNKLQFDQTYSYRVRLAGKTVAENSFASRSKLSSARFVVLGDCGHGTQEQAAVAFQVHQQKPQFVLVTGDVVYTRGLESEYHKNFFPYYNASAPSVAVGAPLLASIPFYMGVGNHDVAGANLDKYPDGLAYFYYSDVPRNAPAPTLTVQATGDPARVKLFKKNTRPRFPAMANFSFDYGNVHIVCLDANLYANPLDPALTTWLSEDLKASKADWKIVAYHHPGFNASKAHYDDQQMRLLAPLMEELNVNIVFSGHVHNYQRSVPLKFAPKKNEAGTQYLISKEGRVDGTFTLDNEFDGSTNTNPKGIIYIVTGAGGAPLYDRTFTNNPELWKHDPPENWMPFTKKMISDIHSYTIIETTSTKFTVKQIDLNGVLIDEIAITK